MINIKKSRFWLPLLFIGGCVLILAPLMVVQYGLRKKMVDEKFSEFEYFYGEFQEQMCINKVAAEENVSRFADVLGFLLLHLDAHPQNRGSRGGLGLKETTINDCIGDMKDLSVPNQYDKLTAISNTFNVYAPETASIPYLNSWYVAEDGKYLLLPSRDKQSGGTPTKLNETTATLLKMAAPQKVANEIPRWSQPRFDPESQAWIISVVMPCYINDKWSGAVGHDLALEKLIDSTEYEPAYGILVFVKKSGTILASRQGSLVERERWLSAKEIIRPDYQALIKTITADMNAGHERLQRVKGTLRGFGLSLPESDWVLIGIAEEEELLHALSPVLGLLWWLTMLTLAALLSGAMVLLLIEHHHQVERNRAELMDRQERERLFAVIEQTDDVVIITDLDGTIVYVNPSFERVTGYTRLETIGKNPRILRSGKHPNEFYQEMWETITSGKTWKGRIFNRKKDGTLYQDDCTIRPLRDEMNRINFYVAVKRDIRHILELEAQLLQAQKLEAVGMLAGGVAHDFNNLLQGILGFSNIIRKKLPADSELADYVGEIVKAGEHATALTRQLLAFSRGQQYQPQTTNLNNVLEQMLKILRRMVSENIKFSFHKAKLLATTVADPLMIEQCVLNMVVNARDAMPEGGVIMLTTSMQTLDAEELTRFPWCHPGEYVRLCIQDTGSGIAPEIAEKIFDPFFTTKEAGKGTGLGLATVYGIMQQHKGLVRVESELGQGTCFELCFPVGELAESAAEAVQAVEDLEQLRGRILLAEDDSMVRQLTATMLADTGFDLHVAQDGQEALDMFEKIGAELNLVILDVVMPGVNGKRVSEIIHQQRPELPILFVTGYSLEGLGDSLQPTMHSEVLLKPYTMETLLQRINKMMCEHANKNKSEPGINAVNQSADAEAVAAVSNSQ